MATNKSPIELLEAANKKKLITKLVKIPLEGDNYINAIVTAPDIISIHDAQRKHYQLELAKLKKESPETFDLPINEDEWNEQLERQESEKTKDQLEKMKPKNLAMQIANNSSTMSAILELMPKCLKDTKGNPLFETIDKQQRFRKIMSINFSIFKLMVDTYIELMSQIVVIEDEVKNLPDQEKSENT